MEFDKLLVRIAKVFNDNKIQYMIIGVQAGIFHGEFRTKRY